MEAAVNRQVQLLLLIQSQVTVAADKPSFPMAMVSSNCVLGLLQAEAEDTDLIAEPALPHSSPHLQAQTLV